MRPFQAPQPKTLTEKRLRGNLSILPRITSRLEKVLEAWWKKCHMRKCQLATHLAGMPTPPKFKVTTEEKVLSMYRQQYVTEEPSTVQEEYNPKVHGESAEKNLQSTVNSVGEQSALLLMAVGDCVINKKSQAEIAKKYGIPRSRVQ